MKSISKDNKFLLMVLVLLNHLDLMICPIMFFFGGGEAGAMLRNNREMRNFIF